MPSTRVAFPEIQSWTPAVDPRAVDNGSLFALSGKNYYFDAKGPRSGFGSATLDGGSIENTIGNIQSIEQESRAITFTSNAAYDRRWSHIDSLSTLPSSQYWFKLADFDPEPESDTGKYCWTGAYVGSGQYVCHQFQGLLQVLGDSLIPFQSAVEIENPLAITEANGRLIILNKYQVAYSNAFDAEDLTPALGGAGFQVVNELVPGTPQMVTSFQGGFLVWTTQGVMIAEYVGGEVVYKFDRIVTDQILLNTSAWCQVSSGVTLVMTEQGVFRSDPTSGVTPVSAVFNEYLRSVFEEIQTPVVRMTYIREFDHLYVQILDGTPNFTRTYVLTVGLDKWGTFSEPHKGICRFSGESGDYGWFDLNGFARRFTDNSFNVNPDGSISGINSEIELGYIRQTAGAATADIEFEMQEILTNSVSKLTDGYPLTEEDWSGPLSFIPYNVGFYLWDENWNLFGVSDFDQDFNNADVDEDWSLPGVDIDYAATVAGARDFDWNNSGPAEDWNIGATDGIVPELPIEDWLGSAHKPDEDWNGFQALFNALSYELEVRSNMDGFEDVLSVFPALAVQKTDGDLWTLFSSGYNHRVFFRATLPFQKFHVRTLATTIYFQGQIS